KKQGGPTDRSAIFECAWAQVPANEKLPCLHDKLLATDQTRRAIDEVALHNGAISNNWAFDTPAAESCQESGAVHVPKGYFVMPKSMSDAPPGRRKQAEWSPPGGFDIGENEGRVRNELREAAQRINPVYNLLASAHRHATNNDLELARALADLSVTGRKAFAQF